MSYQSPIDVIMGQMNMSYENEILKAVQNIGITVDKYELLKALRYDRGQYQKGYSDRDSEIIRCKDCRFRQSRVSRIIDGEECNLCEMVNGYKPADWFCADGKRSE